MALRRTLSKRLFSATNRDPSSPITTIIQHTPTVARLHVNHRQFITSVRGSAAAGGFFRRFSASSLPSFLTLPVGEKLREKLNSLNSLGGRSPPPFPVSPAAEVEGRFSVSVADVKRVLSFLQLEKIRERVRNIPASTIQYGEFVQICGDVCGDKEVGMEFAKTMDESGYVIVLGGVVFLRPEQVAQSVEKLISQSIAMPNDPRIEELAHLENKKALIDQKAQSLVRGELYCGLSFFVLQTLGFMRLTFWELSWDVMEPICFFATSFHFALAYSFFLRTSKEPTFEGYFQRRFKVKQNKLMKLHNFDIERYNKLYGAVNPKC
ncbi:calcium uniporter protein 4 mitochondrial [Phtheirospermum japonicum]|uniref:Calcium uniporter protein 4 mitochondrial n=1 Tax=Phtheirospermum japonicum TaxID=374723 RepID=A0A830CY94_9LAMI|nr:calcium uniporter protein 4 mitochondrial [Phtheirospermum japonicum]